MSSLTVFMELRSALKEGLKYINMIAANIMAMAKPGLPVENRCSTTFRNLGLLFLAGGRTGKMRGKTLWTNRKEKAIPRAENWPSCTNKGKFVRQRAEKAPIVVRAVIRPRASISLEA